MGRSCEIGKFQILSCSDSESEIEIPRVTKKSKNQYCGFYENNLEYLIFKCYKNRGIKCRKNLWEFQVEHFKNCKLLIPN